MPLSLPKAVFSLLNFANYRIYIFYKPLYNLFLRKLNTDLLKLKSKNLYTIKKT